MGKGNRDTLSIARLNWVRAAVLGANDGIVSVSAIILGVAGATNNLGAIFTAGLAGLVAGALSMAVGEYVSVSSQRDTERRFIQKEKHRLKKYPAEELDSLAEAFREKGVSTKTAKQVAAELTKHDAIKAHLDAKLNLDEEDLNDPMHAAIASLLSFTVGAAIPLVAAVLATSSTRLFVTFIAVLVALVLTGYISAAVNDTPRLRAVVRNVVGGALAMIVTFGIGSIFGTAIG